MASVKLADACIALDTLPFLAQQDEDQGGPTHLGLYLNQDNGASCRPDLAWGMRTSVVQQ